MGRESDQSDRNAAATLAKHLADPIAAALGWGGFALFVFAERGIVDQLRKQPFNM